MGVSLKQMLKGDQVTYKDRPAVIVDFWVERRWVERRNSREYRYPIIEFTNGQRRICKPDELEPNPRLGR